QLGVTPVVKYTALSIFVERFLPSISNNRGLARVGELVKFEACTEIIDALYETEETSVLYNSPHFVAASMLVAPYVITVPKQEHEFLFFLGVFMGEALQ
ncbi:hypothetical protein MKW98_013961, partial [Papaver atlanticum]